MTELYFSLLYFLSRVPSNRDYRTVVRRQPSWLVCSWGLLKTVIHIREGLSLQRLLKGYHEVYLKTWTERNLSLKWSVTGSEKPTGNRIAEWSRELELFSSEVERYDVCLFTHLSCMVLWEELGPRWEEGPRREEKGEESRCCELGHKWRGRPVSEEWPPPLLVCGERPLPTYASQESPSRTYVIYYFLKYFCKMILYMQDMN